MPKPATLPYLLDEVNSISITKLKEWAYFDTDTVKQGTVTWSFNGEVSSKAGITVYTNHYAPYIEFNYSFRGEPTKYKVDLVTKPSNLGKGKIWYFVCPSTNKLCRKLYLQSGYFLHRTAIKSNMYESQTKSKHSRLLDTYFGAYFELDELYQELYSKNFKRFYNGKPTKRYLKLMQKINQAERVKPLDLQRALMNELL
jgi:hypothetical protein